MNGKAGLCTLVVLLASLSMRALPADELNAAVAANFRDVTRELIPLFEQATGHTVQVSYGSTGQLYAQIEHGAPFDVLLAADSERPARAEAAGLAVAGSRFTYALGRLVLWSADAALFRDGEQFLRHGSYRHVAIANPATAPYGAAAQQVLERLGLQDMPASRLVRGDSVAQTFQYVATGNAEIGFVAYSQLKSWQGAAGSVWEIPAADYAPIEQQAVLLTRAASNAAARDFLDFLRRDVARTLIRDYGYSMETTVATHAR